MLKYPNINPIAFNIGPIKIHWYGILYLFSILICSYLAKYRTKIKSWSPIQPEQINNLTLYLTIGIILGSRIGYIIFYNFCYYFNNPLQVFFLWNGGMSFHGGLIGAIIVFLLFSYTKNINPFDLSEFIIPVIPIGLGIGRIGNFINGELYGIITNNLYLGMIFPNAGSLPRYPSQLFECFFEGIVLFIILWCITNKKTPRYLVFGLFMFLYGFFRFICEFIRQPDAQYGYIFFNCITMGQILSIPMILIGFIMIIISTINKK